MIPSNRDDQQASAEERGRALLLQRLLVGRLVLLPVAFGMTVATIVLTFLAVLKLFSGDAGVLLRTLPFFAVAAALVAASKFAVPHMDRRILETASSTAGNEGTLGLLRLMIGFPLFSSRQLMENELARQLDSVDESWWEANARELRGIVHATFEIVRHPSWIHPLDGPWIPALLAAMGRCGRTEYMKPIAGLLKPSVTQRMPESILISARENLDILARRQMRDREAATLLRPAADSTRTLLRPVIGAGAVNPDVLLRLEEVDTLSHKVS